MVPTVHLGKAKLIFLRRVPFVTKVARPTNIIIAVLMVLEKKKSAAATALYCRLLQAIADYCRLLQDYCRTIGGYCRLLEPIAGLSGLGYYCRLTGYCRLFCAVI